MLSRVRITRASGTFRFLPSSLHPPDLIAMSINRLGVKDLFIHLHTWRPPSCGTENTSRWGAVNLNFQQRSSLHPQHTNNQHIANIKENADFPLSSPLPNCQSLSCNTSVKAKNEKQRIRARNAYARGGFCFTPFRGGGGVA